MYPSLLPMFWSTHEMLQKTGRRCRVCAHDRRHQIEIGMVLEVSDELLARRFGISRFSVLRHRQNHLTPTQVAAILSATKPSDIDLEALQRDESEGLLANLIAQRARLQTYIDKALEDGDTSGAVRCERSITS